MRKNAHIGKRTSFPVVPSLCRLTARLELEQSFCEVWKLCSSFSAQVHVHFDVGCHCFLEAGPLDDITSKSLILLWFCIGLPRKLLLNFLLCVLCAWLRSLTWGWECQTNWLCSTPQCCKVIPGTMFILLFTLRAALLYMELLSEEVLEEHPGCGKCGLRALWLLPSLEQTGTYLIIETHVWLMLASAFQPCPCVIRTSVEICGWPYLPEGAGSCGRELLRFNWGYTT